MAITTTKATTKATGKPRKKKYRQRVKPVPPPAPGNKFAAGNNGGSPSLYIPEYSVQARKLCQLGATMMEVADFFNLDLKTIYNWQSQYPEFFQALETGKAPADDRVERSFYQRAIGYNVKTKRVVSKAENGDLITDIETHIPGDPSVQTRWLANRRPKKWGAAIDDAPPERSSEEIKAIILGKLAEWGLKVVPADTPIDVSPNASIDAPLIETGTSRKPNGPNGEGSNGEGR